MSSAVIVGKFRYRLDRQVRGVWATNPKALAPHTWPVAYVLGVNPSTADATTNDATIRKVLGFGAVNRWSRVIMGNKFALRSTDVGNLRYAADPVGPLNDTYLAAMMLEADVLIVAWGPLAKLPPKLRGRWREVIVLAAGKPLWCFGTSADGQPRHPLMLRYTTPLVEWHPPYL